MRFCVRILLAQILAAGLLAASAVHAAEEIDLALVLAVDVSRSMDTTEQKLQRDGYVNAFHHPDIIRAITQGGIGKIAVTYVEWSGPGEQIVVVPWTTIESADTAHRFADRLDRAPISRIDRTSISSALTFSAGLLAARGAGALRQVIDVSGDGPNNTGAPVLTARGEVLVRGITINGLPIMLPNGLNDAGSIPDLDLYYRNCVIGGPNAFTIAIRSSSEFTNATRRKLSLEISATEPAPSMPDLVIRTAGPGYDCTAAERQRFFFQP